MSSIAWSIVLAGARAEQDLAERARADALLFEPDVVTLTTERWALGFGPRCALRGASRGIHAGRAGVREPDASPLLHRFLELAGASCA